MGIMIDCGSPCTSVVGKHESSIVFPECNEPEESDKDDIEDLFDGINTSIESLIVIPEQGVRKPFHLFSIISIPFDCGVINIPQLIRILQM